MTLIPCLVRNARAKSKLYSDSAFADCERR